MAIERIEHGDGIYDIKATGKDKAELIGALRDVSDENTQAQIEAKAGNPDRKLANGRTLPAERAERQVRKGVALADIKPALVMPDCSLGFDAAGRVVYSAGDGAGWEAAVTKDGDRGYAFVGGDS